MINNLPDTMLVKVRVEEAPFESLTGMCWIWTGCLNSKGYGCVQISGRRHLTHRVSYELHNGAIRAGLQVDHLCRRRACLNPHHLEAVTASENVRRAIEHRYAEQMEREEEESDRFLDEWFSMLAESQ